ncbi:hypothetical protein CIB48_g7098 [Xylaria polymorpha]|nr:hypothetical protein CIB48_g7098 [Xylaria polymorpha]
MPLAPPPEALFNTFTQSFETRKKPHTIDRGFNATGSPTINYDSDRESDNESDSDSDGEGGDWPQKRQCRSVNHKANKWYEKNVARYMDKGWPEWSQSHKTNKAGNEWYKNNVEVLFERGRGRSRERRGNDPGVQASEPAENADSQPPSLSFHRCSLAAAPIETLALLQA